MRRLFRILCPLLLFLTACGQTAAPLPYAPAEEDRLILYTSHMEEVYGPIVKEFEERTGVWVQVETGGTEALLSRVAAEGETTRCDLFFGGGVDSLQSCAPFFEPYTSPLQETVQPAFRCEDGTWTAFSALPVVLIYNPVLVRSNPPESWASLLDPAWRGKIAFASPEVSGSGYTALAALLQVLPGDEEALLAAFVQNLDGQILEGSSQVTGAVAGGFSYIGVTLEDTALRAIANGRDLALLCPEEGSCILPDGMAVVAGCAHRDNARRFIDFALGEDVQRYLTEHCFRRSVRTDLGQAGEPLPSFGYNAARAGEQREDLLNQWRALCGDGEA